MRRTLLVSLFAAAMSVAVAHAQTIKTAPMARTPASDGGRWWVTPRRRCF